MPTRKKATKHGRVKKTTSPKPGARSSGRKPTGTRVGTVEDWREGGKKQSTARRNQLRDGS